jgi:hypothetical protein
MGGPSLMGAQVARGIDIDHPFGNGGGRHRQAVHRSPLTGGIITLSLRQAR